MNIFQKLPETVWNRMPVRAIRVKMKRVLTDNQKYWYCTRTEKKVWIHVYIEETFKMTIT
jgi:hypothetical protein